MSRHVVDGDTLSRLAARSLELEAERAKVAALEARVHGFLTQLNQVAPAMEALAECARVIPSRVIMARESGEPWCLADVYEAAEAFRAAVAVLGETVRPSLAMWFGEQLARLKASEGAP